MNRRLAATAGLAVSALLIAACSGESTSVTTVYEPENPAPIETPIEMVKPDPVDDLPTSPTTVTAQEFRNWFDANAEDFTNTMDIDQAYTWEGQWTGRVNGQLIAQETITATINPDGSLKLEDIWAVVPDNSLDVKAETGFVRTWVCQPIVDGGQCWFKDSKLPYWQEMARNTRQQILFPSYLSTPANKMFPQNGTYKASSVGQGNFDYVNGGIASAVLESLKSNAKIDPIGDVDVSGNIRFTDDTFSEGDTLRIPVRDKQNREPNAPPAFLVAETTLEVAPSPPVEVTYPDPTEIEKGKGLEFVPLL